MNEEKRRETDRRSAYAASADGATPDGTAPDSVALNSVAWYSATNLTILEQLFPNWVICQCAFGQRPQFLSRNGAAFFGMTPEELATKTHKDLLRLIHPDDVEPYGRIAHRIDEVLKGLDPVEVMHYRFAIRYRLRRRHQYLVVREERLFRPDETGRLTRFTLFRDLSAERVFTRVQLDWYRVHELGCQRINSYVPAAAEGELTAREVEVIQLIKRGLSSKEIAHQLSISINTVRNHRSNLFRKTQARNVVDLVKSTARLEVAN